MSHPAIFLLLALAAPLPLPASAAAADWPTLVQPSPRPSSELIVLKPASAPGAAQYRALDEVVRLRAATQQALGSPSSLRTLRIGDNGDDVVTLRASLRSNGFTQSSQPQDLSAEPSVFDEELLREVRSAKKFFGLRGDGEADESLFDALQINDPMRIKEAEAWADGLDRASRLAADRSAKRFIVVNLATYTLWVFNVQTGETELESRVIVGKPSTKTPRMTMDVVNLKYNPDWTPPPSIRGKHTRPGPHNPLGQVRFSTNASVAIYLHDTNQRYLFDNDFRALSHGCIRVQSWTELAAVLSEVTTDEVLTQVGVGHTHFQHIDPVPVVLAYDRTALKDGILVRFPDVYDLGDQVQFPEFGDNTAESQNIKLEQQDED
jgi:murein L,D-transpeptidase YcbB/YkuD